MLYIYIGIINATAKGGFVQRYRLLRRYESSSNDVKSRVVRWSQKILIY